MRVEREYQPRPAWEKALAEFQRARDRYLTDPTSGNMIFTRVFHERLLAELFKPGKFELGHAVMTRGAHEAINQQFHMPAEFLIRHKHGDWGDLCEEDKQENELSLRRGFRLLSSYPLRKEGTMWVITDADRSTTTLLLPEEY